MIEKCIDLYHTSTRCTLETILLIYSEICKRTGRRWSTRVFLRRHICICVHVSRCQPPPRATNVAVRDAEYVRWTLTRKWRRRDRFVLGLRQQVDEAHAYGTPSTRRETKERKSLFCLKNDHRRPLEQHASQF